MRTRDMGKGESHSHPWHVDIRVGIAYLYLNGVCLPLHVHLGAPCRRIILMGIAHPVLGKYFQVLEVHREMKHIQELSCEKGQKLAYSCIL